MKKIGFMGAIDKSDLMINVAKVLQVLGYKVLVVDSSSTQKIKYIVPSINPTKSYITNFEDIDFGVGFSSWEEVEKYLGIKFYSSEEEQPNNNRLIIEKKETKSFYDYALIDIDDDARLENFEIKNAEKKYFLTKFDKFSLTKGINIFRNLKEPMDLTKILFSYTSCSREEEEYLNFISSYYKINWMEYKLYFRIEGEDNRVFEENQRLEKIRLSKLSPNYKESLSYLVQDICKTDSMGKIKRAMKI